MFKIYHQETENLIEFLDARFTLKDLKIITYRTINYWDEAGFLLRKRRKTDKGWRRFSLIEFLWIKLLDEIRELNIPIETVVKNLFTCLGHKGTDKSSIEKAQINFLSIIKQCAYKKQKVDLFITKFAASFNAREGFENYIVISINKLIIDFVRLQLDQNSKTPLLTEDELEILTTLRQDNIVELSAEIMGEILSIDILKKQIAFNTLLEIIYKPYSIIKYKTKGGKTVIIDKE